MKVHKPTLEEHISEGHSPQSIYGYVRIIKQYIRYEGEAAAKKAMYPEIVHYIGALRKQGSHPKTIMNHLYAVKMYYQWLVDTGERDDHPCRDLYLKDKINRAIAVEVLYTKKELEEILISHRAKLPLTRLRDKIVLSLLVYQAVTVFEIIHIKVEDINLIKGTLNLEGCVKTQPRLLPLKTDQIMLLNDYITRIRPLLLKNNKTPSQADKVTLLLSTRGNCMKPVSLSAMFKAPMSSGHKITPQKIRQSTIANMLKSGQDLRVVQALTGHKRVSSVEQYRQTGLEELKTLVQKYHPLQ